MEVNGKDNNLTLATNLLVLLLLCNLSEQLFQFLLYCMDCGKLPQHKSVNPWKSNGLYLCQITWLTIIRKIWLVVSWDVKLVRRVSGTWSSDEVTVGLHNVLWKYSIRYQKNTSSAVYHSYPELYSETLRVIWIKSLKDLRLEIALRKRIIMKLLSHS